MKFKLTFAILTLCTAFLLTAQTQLGEDIDGEFMEDQSGSGVSISADGNRVAIGAIRNAGNGSNSGHTRIFEFSNNSWNQIGQDIDGEDPEDFSGSSVSISADGNRVAIGARQNQGNGPHAGHTRIFEFSNNLWTQIGQDIDGETQYDFSGSSVSISADGNRVAIGTGNNDGNGDESGHTRIFEYDGSLWTQVGQDIDGENPGDQSGYSVSISADGNRVIIGAPYNDDVDVSTGHSRVFEYDGNLWNQIGQNIDGEFWNDQSGVRVAISADGNRVAIGDPFYDENGDASGRTRILEYNGNIWTQIGPHILGENPGDWSGINVSMSSDGNRDAIGAYKNDDNGSETGHTRIFEFNGTIWSQLGEDMDGENPDDNSGRNLSLSADGNRVAIGAALNDGNGNFSGHTRIYEFAKPNLISDDSCFTLDHNPSTTQYILEGDFTNCNIFVLDENENVVQFLLNIFDKIIIDIDELPAGLHFIRVEHQQHNELFVQEIIKL